MDIKTLEDKVFLLTRAVSDLEISMARQGLDPVESVAIFLLRNKISHDEGVLLVEVLQNWDKEPLDLDLLLKSCNDLLVGEFRFEQKSLEVFLGAIVRQIECAHCKRILNEIRMSSYRINHYK